MAATSLSGLASGLDWTSLINTLITADSAPVTRLQTEQSTISTKNSSLTSLQSKLSDLQTAVSKLNDSSLFSQRSSTISNSQWSVSTTNAAAATSHTISVSQLATASSLQGASDISGPLRADGDTSQLLISAMNTAQTVTAGDFTVNGARVSLSVTDTLDEVFQKISAATNGTVTASYNGSTDKMTLTSSSGEVVLGSANDSSNFLQVMKLGNNGSGSVSSSAQLGATNLDTTLGSAGLKTAVSGTGSFSVNGQTISYDASTDTLRTIMAKINNSSAGVTASYDSQNDRLVLANNVTGDLGVSVQSISGNLAGALGLTSATLQHGQNAQFTVDGGATRTSTTNTLDESALGLPGVSITATSETSERLGVSGDSTNATAAIKDFITKFNAVQSYVSSQTAISTSGTKVTSSPLTGDRNVIEIGRSLRTQAFAALGGSTVSRLDSLGIEFDGTSGNLVLKDDTKLSTALSSNSSGVASFFTDSTTGFANKFNTYLSAQTGTTGSLQQEMDANTTRSTSINTQIATLQRYLDSERASLTAKFTQMEQLQSTLQTQAKSLTAMFSSTSA